MTVIILFILGMTVAYQADKPCDDACFKAKVESESKNGKIYKNDWRYERPNRRR